MGFNDEHMFELRRWYANLPSMRLALHKYVAKRRDIWAQEATHIFEVWTFGFVLFIQ
jgi:hypothetical protein